MRKQPEPADLFAIFGSRVSRSEPLARHTTFRIGGPADLFLRVDTREELVEAVRAVRGAGLPFFILGNGSNILVADAGVRGLVIENHADAYATREEGECLVLAVESGGSLPGLANRMARQGWSGLEWAIGVPSTIGAAIVGNAGAHGGAIADSLRRAEVLAVDGAISWRPNAEFDFAYRSSRLKERPGEWTVLQAEFELERQEPSACMARMSQYVEHRRRTQPTDPSIGSMFKNPPGDYAGRLIEAAGLKGMRIGQVEVSPVHANFFVNHGGASAREVVELMERVRATVRENSGVELELEIQLIGDWTK